MPLTPAHPAVVLPFQRLGLPTAALVVGAVAPDLPVYLPVGVSYRTTHSGPGIGVDVVIGLGLLWLWSAVVRDALVDLATPLRSRAPARVRPDRRAWLLAPLALAAGAASHVLWDSATHDWGFVVGALDPLRAEYGPLVGYSWLQVLSTLVGGAVVAAYCGLALRGRPVVPRPSSVRRPGSWLVPVPVAALVAGIGLRDPWAGVGAGLLALLAVALAWRWVRPPG